MAYKDTSTGPSTGAKLIGRRHAEFVEHQTRWRFLQDSLEGGDRYRFAIYGMDTEGQPVMNLIRHRREYAPENKNQQVLGTVFTAYSRALLSAAGQAGLPPRVPATDNDFALRVIRTPVPTFVSEAVTRHLSRIYSREVAREAEKHPDIAEWWDDVDGLGTSIDEWMSDTVGPLLLTLGQIDLQFDRPAAPDDAEITNRAQEKLAGVNKCVASYILPENMLWWKLDARGRYKECLVQEYIEDDEGCLERHYRHWTAVESRLYDCEGELESVTPHPYGRVPIRRMFTRRKARHRNVGQSDYDAIADRQREYYNRDSELILSDSLQAHALFSGPDDYIREDGTLNVGPGYYLPKKKCESGATVFYEGFEYVDPPKGASESIRQNKQDIRDEVDREAALAKPAGSAGTGNSTVGQSGKSKELDHVELNDLLTRRVGALTRCERTMVEFAAVVINGGPVAPEDYGDVEVRYPAEFDLYSADDLSAMLTEWQGIASGAGAMPQSEGLLLKKLIRLDLPGQSDATYAELDAEIDSFLAEQVRQRDQYAEAAGPNAAVSNFKVPLDKLMGTGVHPEPAQPPSPPKAQPAKTA